MLLRASPVTSRKGGAVQATLRRHVIPHCAIGMGGVEHCSACVCSGHNERAAVATPMLEISRARSKAAGWNVGCAAFVDRYSPVLPHSAIPTQGEHCSACLCN